MSLKSQHSSKRFAYVVNSSYMNITEFLRESFYNMQIIACIQTKFTIALILGLDSIIKIQSKITGWKAKHELKFDEINNKQHIVHKP